MLIKENSILFSTCDNTSTQKRCWQKENSNNFSREHLAIFIKRVKIIVPINWISPLLVIYVKKIICV